MDDTNDSIDAGAEVIRSEERLVLGTEVVARERVRFEKYIVTEQKTVTVELRREELRITREPLEPTVIEQASLTDDGPLVLTLSEERVAIQTVPVESVRVSRIRVPGRQTVGAELRGERVEVDPNV